jgi:hypothetical protein
MSHTFTAFEFVTYFNVPSYGEWLRDRPDYAAVFKWHKQVLQHLGSAAPVADDSSSSSPSSPSSSSSSSSTNDSHKPWVLKVGIKGRRR